MGNDKSKSKKAANFNLQALSEDDVNAMWGKFDADGNGERPQFFRVSVFDRDFWGQLFATRCCTL